MNSNFKKVTISKQEENGEEIYSLEVKDKKEEINKH